MRLSCLVDILSLAKLINRIALSPGVCVHILYSQKYWQKLNLAVGLQITIAKILADLNLAVW